MAEASSESIGKSPKPPKCEYCHESVPDGAKICRHCYLFKTPFRNWWQQVGVSVAILTFLITNIPVAFDVLFGRPEVTVVSVSWPDEMAVLNSGVGGVLLERLDLESKELMNGTFSAQYPIYELVPEGGVEKHSFQRVLGSLSNGGSVISGVSDEEWDQMRKNPFQGGHFSPQFFERGSPGLANLRKQLGASLRTFEVTGVLTYRAVDDPRKKLTVRVDLEGVFVKAVDAPTSDQARQP